MFNRLKSIFRSRTPPKQLVRARFDAAQTTRDNWRHWSAADHLSADMEAAPEVRRTLRMRSRYEVANNSYARGLVQMLANDTIGTGPRLQMLSADETFNDAVETAFMRWSDAVRALVGCRSSCSETPDDANGPLSGWRSVCRAGNESQNPPRCETGSAVD